MPENGFVPPAPEALVDQPKVDQPKVDQPNKLGQFKDVIKGVPARLGRFIQRIRSDNANPRRSLETIAQEAPRFAPSIEEWQQGYDSAVNASGEFDSSVFTPSGYPGESSWHDGLNNALNAPSTIDQSPYQSEMFVPLPVDIAQLTQEAHTNGLDALTLEADPEVSPLFEKNLKKIDTDHLNLVRAGIMKQEDYDQQRELFRQNAANVTAEYIRKNQPELYARYERSGIWTKTEEDGTLHADPVRDPSFFHVLGEIQVEIEKIDPSDDDGRDRIWQHHMDEYVTKISPRKAELYSLENPMIRDALSRSTQLSQV